MRIRIGLGQMCSGQNKKNNLEQAVRLVTDLAARGAELVMLPENFSYVGPDESKKEQAEELDNSPTLDFMRDLARQHAICLHCGSFPEKVGESIHNTTVVLGPDGGTLAIYRKIHLFDVEVPGGRSYLESQVISPGSEVVVFSYKGIDFGLATCYDLRFPEMFRHLVEKGARVLLLPAAFTLQTGRDHWEVLLRARAIENLAWLAACGQWGETMVQTPCFGRSMVIDPWGLVVAQAADGVTGLLAELDLERQETIRATFPVLKHRRQELF